jgi:hypothetical protein
MAETGNKPIMKNKLRKCSHSATSYEEKETYSVGESGKYVT